jgi:GH35 family endo-1,4-beta-xylanase
MQEDRYREVVGAYIDSVPPEQRGGIVVWGVSDADSSAQTFMRQIDWPLLFDEDLVPKVALRGFAEGLIGW